MCMYWGGAKGTCPVIDGTEVRLVFVSSLSPSTGHSGVIVIRSRTALTHHFFYREDSIVSPCLFCYLFVSFVKLQFKKKNSSLLFVCNREIFYE